MSRQDHVINVLGLDITFRPGADMDRAERLARYVEERFEAQKQKYPGAQGKDILLTFLVLGLAEDLLQMKIEQEQAQNRMEKLLVKIEKSF